MNKSSKSNFYGVYLYTYNDFTDLFFTAYRIKKLNISVTYEIVLVFIFSFHFYIKFLSKNHYIATIHTWVCKQLM